MKILVVSEIKYPKLIHSIKNVIQFNVLQYVYSSSFLAFINESQSLLFHFLLNTVHHILTTTEGSHHMTSLWAGQVWLKSQKGKELFLFSKISRLALRPM